MSLISALLEPLLIGILLLLLAGHALAEPVGHITLAIGQAWHIAPDGSRRPAIEQSPVGVGDTLETAPSGQIHLRFIDGATVAIRPESRLTILDYSDPTRGGAVRFQLQNGTVRAITGRYGQTDHNRFRLNTPIAAIGITGTDFVVENRDILRARVFSGGIIAAPFDEHCTPDSLGPCATPRAQRLTAEMGLILELRPNDPAPRLLPLPNNATLSQEARRRLRNSQYRSSEGNASPE